MVGEPSALATAGAVGMVGWLTKVDAEQVAKLASDYGVYAVKNGRICICGLNHGNVAYVAKAISAVL